MRTVLARLVALGALSVVVGCSGNSTSPLPISGGLNGTGGSQGINTGSTTGGSGGSAPAASTDQRTLTPNPGASAIFAAGTAGWQYTFQFGTSNGFVLTPTPPSTTMTAQLDQSVTPFAGVAPLVLPAPAPGSPPPIVLQYGRLTVTGGTITGTKTPVIIIQGVTPIPGHGNTVSLAAINATTGAWVVPVVSCTVQVTTATCPSTALPFNSATPFIFAIYAP